VIVSVIGSEEAGADSLRLAEEVGRALGRRGITVACGGGGGIMEAACRGARSSGGHTIGILPGHNAGETPPNAWVEFPIFTGLGAARNSIVVLAADAVIAIDGAYGTLSEIAFALIHKKPIVGIHTWEFSYAEHEADHILRAEDAPDAVEMVVQLVEALPPAGR